MRNTDWMAGARCHNGSEYWTGERRPSQRIVDRLAEVCSFCPVLAQCGAYALDADAELGMYAGVWLPLRASAPWRDPRPQWLAARAELAERIDPCLVAN